MIDRQRAGEAGRGAGQEPRAAAGGVAGGVASGQEAHTGKARLVKMSGKEWSKMGLI